MAAPRWFKANQEVVMAELDKHSAQAAGSVPCNIDEAASYKWAADVLTSAKLSPLSPHDLQRLADRVAGAIKLAYDLGIKTGWAQNAPLTRNRVKPGG